MVAILIVAVGVMGRPTLSADAAAVGRPPADWPRHSARAATVIEAESGRVLYAASAHDRLPPASLTKMVTALVAVERSALDRPIEPRRSYPVVPAIIGIGIGDSLPLEEALHGLLLNSGNDVALAIAETLGEGSVDRYVGWMQELTNRLGLADTRFANPHGLDEPGHLSSAYDMAVVGRVVMRHPVLSRIVGQRRRVFRGPPAWLFLNTNPLLGRYEGLDGIKTGYDDLAGRCLVATAVRDGRRAIAVVMNSDRYAADSIALLDAAFSDQSWPALEPVPKYDGLPVARLRADLVGAALDGEPRSVHRASRRATAGMQ